MLPLVARELWPFLVRGDRAFAAGSLAAAPRAVASTCTPRDYHPNHLPVIIVDTFMYCLLARVAGFLPALGSVV